MRVAFQGIHGAYSELAARTFFGPHCRTLPFERFDQVFDAVERKKADRAVVPIENSLAGSIHENYDLLLAHTLHIVGEIHLRIEHALLCHPSAQRHDLVAVRSHPIVFEQCSQFLARYPRLKREAYFDTAGAAQSIASNNDRCVAAIAGVHAARMYGLKILRRNIENRAHNFTRFLILARSPRVPHRKVRTKTSIVFMPKVNEPGVLFRCLGVFYVRSIDLLKIESRPDPDSPFEYMFYLDVEGNPNQRRVAEALEHLQEITKMFRVFGAYPMGRGNFYGAAGKSRKERR
jgi:arogenate/prephenate dehydratase